jgi:hypothetical protein
LVINWPASQSWCSPLGYAWERPTTPWVNVIKRFFFFCTDVFHANKLECLYLGKPSKTSTISQQYTKRGPKGANTLAYFVGASVSRGKKFFDVDTWTTGWWHRRQALWSAVSPDWKCPKEKKEIMLNWAIFKFTRLRSQCYFVKAKMT